MGYVKFAALSIKKNAAAFVLVIFELAALLLTVNFAVSTVIDRRMLNVPFGKILKGNTIYAADLNYIEKHMEHGLNHRQSRQVMLDEIVGNYKIYDVLSYNGEGETIISVSDEIYSRLKMPLVSGSYKTAVGTVGTAPGEHSVTVNGRTLSLSISGNLTANTFIPTMNAFGSSGLTTKDIFDSSSNRSNIIVTSRSAIAGFENDFTVSIGFFITLESNFEENFSALSRSGGAVLGTDMLKNSNAAVGEDILSLLPIMLCVLFIVIIGMVSISVIISDQNEYRNGVMWLCGYSKKQVLMAHAVNILIILIASAAVGAAALGALKLAKNEFALTMNLTLANLIISIILCAALLFISLAVPVAKSAKKSPIEYLVRTRQ